MKVCIIGHTEKNYLPYMDKYIHFLQKNNIEYDILYWQREESTVAPSENEYHYFSEPKEGALNKLLAYRGFKKFVISVLEKNHYDRVIVLTTVPCVALRKYLLKHYSNKYLLDVRDYSFEKFGFYRKIVDRLIEHSALTTISSKGFMDFLNDNPKIIMNHNINYTENLSSTGNLKEKQVINIGFIGGVRYYDENTALIEKLKNTFRYQLWYIGQPVKNCDLPAYCKEHDVTNVSFVGKYNNEQKPEFYRNIDIINSIYGNSSLEVTTALPNRLYEACLFKKPIISSKGTYLGEVIHQYQLGLVVDVEKDDVLAMLDHYVDTFDEQAFLQGCEKFLATVKEDERILSQNLKKFIKE